MRIASWNLNHRAQARRVHDWIAMEGASVAPDVLVCTEYVQGHDHSRFVAALSEIGLRTVHTSRTAIGHNQVLIASRDHARRGRIYPPRTIAPAVPSNALHVSCTGLDVLGFRMPYFGRSGEREKRATWEWLAKVARTRASQPFVIIGDFNTQAGDSRKYCGDCLDTIFSLGWRQAIPRDGHSWKHGTSGKGRRIDYALLSPLVACRDSRYSWEFVSRNQLKQLNVGIPDHALLVMDIAPDQSSTLS